jgi:hypothetical protein
VSCIRTMQLAYSGPGLVAVREGASLLIAGHRSLKTPCQARRQSGAGNTSEGISRPVLP